MQRKMLYPVKNQDAGTRKRGKTLLTLLAELERLKLKPAQSSSSKPETQWKEFVRELAKKCTLVIEFADSQIKATQEPELHCALFDTRAVAMELRRDALAALRASLDPARASLEPPRASLVPAPPRGQNKLDKLAQQYDNLGSLLRRVFLLKEPRLAGSVDAVL
jgi:hypothetical protein